MSETACGRAFRCVVVCVVNRVAVCVAVCVVKRSGSSSCGGRRVGSASAARRQRVGRGRSEGLQRVGSASAADAQRVCNGSADGRRRQVAGAAACGACARFGLAGRGLPCVSSPCVLGPTPVGVLAGDGRPWSLQGLKAKEAGWLGPLVVGVFWLLRPFLVVQA